LGPKAFLPAFDKCALPEGWSHAKSQFGEAIQLRSHSLNMAMLFRFDEDPHRSHTAKAEASSPSASRAVVQEHECIGQGAGQVERAAFSRAKFGVVVGSGSPPDFDPGLVKVRNIAPLRSATVKLLLHLEGDDDLAEQKRQ
jgi:hypothetical protein